MLTVAYRNLNRGADRNRGKCQQRCAGPFAHSGSRTSRQVHRRATESLLGDLLELVAGGPLSRWQITRNHNGKPTVVNSDGQSAIEVSVSHSGRLALAGITDLGESASIWNFGLRDDRFLR